MKWLIPVLALPILSLGRGVSAQSSFFDDFESFDRERWFVSDGWTNGPHQNCWWSADALDLPGDGALSLRLRETGEADRPYICAEIQTRERFHHGTFEVRMRTDRWSGVNAAFFTYIGPAHDAPHDEIDVEILTRDPGEVALNTFIGGEMRHGETIDLPVPADDGFHDYAFTWEAERIRWFIDGELVHEATGELPTHPQKIYLSHWSTDELSDWMGPFAPPGRDLALEVDWVAWTAPGEGCAFPQSILCTEAAE
ncbi:family 16 glycosylhydrolase [Pseudoroseicyclus tamaricis]|uniref:Family 16 glycosylhydrolase n=1 Tax=Pseudoroseicyclus tamaricis TaxID=2705421 RepID=A0A6B2JRY8_9RHOB|nr:family 16 glycosylhydrolase [Pseudoroseicyclus tamaricis]NDV01337.1 family 16 glycosylhydrolase [Pseudoroseicyclus tamaricis]